VLIFTIFKPRFHLPLVARQQAAQAYYNSQ